MAKPKVIEATVERAKLLRAAKICAATADHRSPILPYQSTMVRISWDGCDLTATNGMVSTRSVPSIGAAGEMASLCVNAKRLYDVVNQAPDGYLQLISGENQLTVSSGPGRAQTKIAAFPAKDFPVVNFPSSVLPLVERAVLSRLLRRTAFSANQVAGPPRDRINLDAIGGRLEVWAFSGHTISFDAADVKLPDARASLHVSAAQVFRTAIDADDSHNVEMALGEEIVVVVGGTTVMAKSQGSQIWDWRGMMPKPRVRLSCDRDALLEAVSRASMFTLPDKPMILLDGEKDYPFLRIDGASADGGSSTEVEVSGEPGLICMGASWRYLREALSVVDTDRVDLEFAGEYDPIVIRPAGVTDGQIHLISPMKRD